MRALISRGAAGWSRWERLWLDPVDARVYAWLRLAFALVALANLVDLWPHRAVFFSGVGMIDREAGLSGVTVVSGRFSLFHWLDSPGVVTVSFLVAAAALVALGLGVGARAMIVIVFAWQLSCTYRAYAVIHGWDILLRNLAFLLLISPLGPPVRELWARGGAIRRRWAPRHGLVLTQLLLAVIYWQTVWLKVADPAWRSGEFLSHFMLSLYSRFQTPAWAGWELLSSLLSHATLLIELVVPLLLWNRRTRRLGFALGFGLHLGILAVSHIWLFSLAILVPYCAFLDGRDLDALGRGLRDCARRRLRRDSGHVESQ